MQYFYFGVFMEGFRGHVEPHRLIHSSFLVIHKVGNVGILMKINLKQLLVESIECIDGLNYNWCDWLLYPSTFQN